MFYLTYLKDLHLQHITLSFSILIITYISLSILTTITAYIERFLSVCPQFFVKIHRHDTLHIKFSNIIKSFYSREQKCLYILMNYNYLAKKPVPAIWN